MKYYLRASLVLFMISGLYRLYLCLAHKEGIKNQIIITDLLSVIYALLAIATAISEMTP